MVKNKKGISSKISKTCSICFREYEGFGNNAQPINDGRCCNDCDKIVIVARINKWILRKT